MDHVPNSSWVVPIKSKYAKHQDKGGLCAYEAKGKLISQHALCTSEYALRGIRNQVCFKFLAKQSTDK